MCGLLTVGDGASVGGEGRKTKDWRPGVGFLSLGCSGC